MRGGPPLTGACEGDRQTSASIARFNGASLACVLPGPCSCVRRFGFRRYAYCEWLLHLIRQDAAFEPPLRYIVREIGAFDLDHVLATATATHDLDLFFARDRHREELIALVQAHERHPATFREIPDLIEIERDHLAIGGNRNQHVAARNLERERRDRGGAIF